MWPSFTVRVLQDPEVVQTFCGLSKESWAVIGQWVSAIAIFWAAWYASHYQKKKDEKERNDKLVYIQGRVTTILEKSKFFLEKISKIPYSKQPKAIEGDEMYLDALTKKTIIINAIIESFRVKEDLDFLVANDKVINSFITSPTIKISSIVLDYQFFIYSLDATNKFKLVGVEDLRRYLKSLRSSIVVVKDDFETLSKELETVKTKLFKGKN